MESKIYVVADIHYGHKNIIKGVSRWTNQNALRDFGNVKEMNEAILTSINNTVGVNDILIFLGDLSFVHERETIIFLGKIKCHNLVMILGNHDHRVTLNKPVVFKNADIQRLPKEMFGNPPADEVTYTLSSMFKSIHPVRVEFEYKEQIFILDHYPLEAWDHSYKGSIMCHGHVHGALDYSDINMYHKRIDVRWDLFQRPISLDEIIELMKDREPTRL